MGVRTDFPRRVRRIELTQLGRRTVTGILSAGAERQRTVLSRLTASELAVVEHAAELLVSAAEAAAAEEEESGQV